MDVRDAFEKYFLNFEPVALRRKAIETGLNDFPLRGLCWRLFLGVLPSLDMSSWEIRVQNSRELYIQTRYECMNESSFLEAIQMAQMSSTASILQESAEVLVKQYEEVKREIMQDIERTFPDNSFFQNERIRGYMLNILYIYAVQHPEIKYRQGMHELLAVIIYALHGDNMKNRGDLLSYLVDEMFLEHDSATLFYELMKTCSDWFATSNEQLHGIASPRRTSGKMNSFHKKDDIEASPIVKKCHYIHHVILKNKDPELYKTLEELQIEPQLYGLRWIRLLFGREFQLPKLLVIWDALFAEDLAALVDYICVSMLIKIRMQIIGQEYIVAMKNIFTYPEIDEPQTIVQTALHLRDSRKPLLAIQGTLTQAKHALDSIKALSSPRGHQRTEFENSPKSEHSSQRWNRSSGSFTARQLPMAILNPTLKTKDRDQGDTRVQALLDENAKLKRVQERMANRLLQMITTMELEVNGNQSHPEAIDIFKLQCALAELKRVKNILAQEIEVASDDETFGELCQFGSESAKQ
eukprot:TRINITY_DN6850_c0_g1_i4.p1 TRINITY_DN6850_c0_g1~~TRINITY_DN6850_c0_g1_i4.p1  ORF type:complete len:524 (+),score=112.67 TRINITY_DN6850_c0_g1_i4:116-1687(+)